MEDGLSSDPTRGSRSGFPFSKAGRTTFCLVNTDNVVLQLEANATGTIIYAITIFASEPAVIINIIDEESDPNVVIQELRNIQLNRSKNNTFWWNKACSGEKVFLSFIFTQNPYQGMNLCFSKSYFFIILHNSRTLV